jgi:metal-dependent amidase/aminoacylase/carboxypeptidase family protein
VTYGLAKTGVIGELGEGTPIVAIRAAMDTLPLAETNELTFTSQVSNIMHACGHDTQVA